MATITLHVGCCEKGGEHLTFIPAERCNLFDVDPPQTGFFIDVSGGYPDPAWERIYYCPFCGKEIATPMVV
jgi:hypothetical protein